MAINTFVHTLQQVKTLHNVRSIHKLSSFTKWYRMLVLFRVRCWKKDRIQGKQMNETDNKSWQKLLTCIICKQPKNKTICTHIMIPIDKMKEFRISEWHSDNVLGMTAPALWKSHKCAYWQCKRVLLYFLLWKLSDSISFSS